eukprot:TRINITY_DN5264_c0_g1_i1.p1 TRINITY_DN5264_c0_g1~~TRINITY_DN5264_c0_g1_i1.p1  ORF type:complete len:107 (-),score=14.46 TRINITY_DN5264_c0_g1_i1:206-526(-)
MLACGLGSSGFQQPGSWLRQQQQQQSGGGSGGGAAPAAQERLPPPPAAAKSTPKCVLLRDSFSARAAVCCVVYTEILRTPAFSPPELATGHEPSRRLRILRLPPSV